MFGRSHLGLCVAQAAVAAAAAVAEVSGHALHAVAHPVNAAVRDCERGCTRDDSRKAGPLSVERLKMDLPTVQCFVHTNE